MYIYGKFSEIKVYNLPYCEQLYNVLRVIFNLLLCYIALFVLRTYTQIFNAVLRKVLTT